jgi:hypothetical protein
MSLAKKLLLSRGQRVLVLRAPQTALDAIAPPEGVELATSHAARGVFDVVVLFVSSDKGLADHAPKAIAAVKPGGVLWFAYPKKTSGVVSDLSRDDGWQALISRGWGPVAQVAVDATWSAVRFEPEASGARKVPGRLPGAASQAARAGAGGAAKRATADLVVPDELEDGLSKDKAAKATWKALTPSHKREYVSWIGEAKRPETRARRIAQALALLAQGVRDRNDKDRA